MKKADHSGSRSKRLGGKGLSLDAFVRAKGKPRYNPSDIRKHREHYENAKKVKTYRTMIKQIPQLEQDAQKDIGMQEERLDYNANVLGCNSSFTRESHPQAKRLPAHKNKKWKNGNNTLERMRHDYMERKQDEEKLKQAREEAQREKDEADKMALKKRKELKVKMFKKTSTGQPLMKHRLEHILERLQQQQ